MEHKKNKNDATSRMSNKCDGKSNRRDTSIGQSHGWTPLDGIGKTISCSACIAWKKNSKYCQLNQNRTQNNTSKENEMKDNITKHTQKKLRIRQIRNWARYSQDQQTDQTLFYRSKPNNTLSASMTILQICVCIKTKCKKKIYRVRFVSQKLLSRTGAWLSLSAILVENCSYQRVLTSKQRGFTLDFCNGSGAQKN